VQNNNGLDVNILEAGFETAGRLCVLLLHGFPATSPSNLSGCHRWSL